MTTSHPLESLGIDLIWLMKVQKLSLRVSFLRAAPFSRKYFANFILLGVPPSGVSFFLVSTPSIVFSWTNSRDDLKHCGTNERSTCSVFVRQSNSWKKKYNQWGVWFKGYHNKSQCGLCERRRTKMTECRFGQLSRRAGSISHLVSWKQASK